MGPISFSHPNSVQNTDPDSGTVIRNLAHELRQPLSALESIVFYLDLMITDDDPKTRKQLRKLRRLVQQSEWTVSNAVLTAGVAPLALTPACLADVVSECVTTWAAENSAQAGLVRPDKDRMQLLDEEHVRQMLRNILSFVRKKSHVSIAVTTLANSTEVAIESQEMRVPEEDSLAMTAIRKVAAMHKGTVTIEDEEDSKRIRVCFPVRF